MLMTIFIRIKETEERKKQILKMARSLSTTGKKKVIFVIEIYC